MKSLLTSLLLVFASSFASAQTPPPLPEATPPYYRVRYEPSTQSGELIYGVSYTLWIPAEVKTLRGIIVHQHGCGEGACKAGQTAAFDLHWQALAKKHQCALLGPSYEQPEKANCAMWCDARNGSEKTFLRALGELATLTRHPELATAPWALWGHSGGANWAGTMLMLHPDRIAAVWLRSGSPKLLPQEVTKQPPLDIPTSALSIPVMCNLGTKEGVTVKEGRFAKVWESTEKFFTDMRGKGALIGVAVDPLTSHECGNQRYLAIPWIDACLTSRLAEKSGDALKPMPVTEAWLAPLLGDSAEPAASFTGDVSKSVWLPNEAIAKAWISYVKDTAVPDTTPPPAPNNLQLSAANELTWQAEADLESGLASFIIERNGAEIARLPQKSASPFGRPIFQTNNYSDTPSQPLAQMKFTDITAKPGDKHAYSVKAINTVGLISEPGKASLK
jgi:hypothetical protein